MPEEILVNCNVYDGMFSDEAVVEIGDASYVVPKSNVVDRSGARGKLRARRLKRSDGDWVVLPTAYSDTIPVNDKVKIAG